MEPKETLNPFFQFTYHCLHERFLNPRDSLPEPPANTEASSRVPPSSQLDDIRRLFPLLTSSVSAAVPKRWKDMEM